MSLLQKLNFEYCASVPWPAVDDDFNRWKAGIDQIDFWLQTEVGPRLVKWEWCNSRSAYEIGIAFQYDRDCMLFLLHWS